MQLTTLSLSLVNLYKPFFSSFTPLSLFAAGEQGAWYDPSDFSTLFQDSAGTTPVTAFEQPVGLMLDKSGRGNHAFQSAVNDRPVISARVNLLTNTETLATQTITTMATSQRLRFEGTGTITLSGTATGTYSAGTHTLTTTAGSLTLTVSGTVTKADFRAANDGVGLPEYQRVNTSTDYDTVGFPAYLRFFGTNTWMQTASINFTSTDKMTLWAGVRSNQQMSSAVIFELSTNSQTASPAGFALISNRTSQVTNNYANVSSKVFGLSSSKKVPFTFVFAVDADIAADKNILFANRSVIATSTQDQGLGNYGNHNLYIGRRAESTFLFSGRLYQFIVCGASKGGVDFTNATKFVYQKSGIFFSDKKYYILGDSTIGQYSDSSAVTDFIFSSNETINLAVPGHTIQQQKTIWQSTSVNAEKTSYVVIQVGLNDLNPSEPASSAISRLQDLVNTVRLSVGIGVPIFVSKMIPCRQRLINIYGATDGLVAQQKWVNINEAIAGVGASPITNVDGRITSHVSLMSDGSGNLKTEYDSGDGIHPNNLGRIVNADAISDFIFKYGIFA